MSKQPKKLQFQPINEAHAIVEAVIFFEFEPVFNEADLSRFLPLQQELKTEFPVGNPMQMIQFRIDQQTGTQALEQRPSGLELKSVDEAGAPEWLVRIIEPNISIHCLKYTRWDNVWKQASKTLTAVFSKIGPTQSVLRNVGLKYIDRFVYDGDEDKLDITALINAKCAYITPKSFETDGRWHTHSGWFEKGENGSEILNQVNIDAAFQMQDNKRRHFTTIDMNHIARNLTPESVPSLKEALEKGAVISTLLDRLHNLNKAVLSDILTADVRKRINLK